ncbi:MAG: hypothetical protein ABI346_01880 [Candidatus Baltobacteraceae bacterium]
MSCTATTPDLTPRDQVRFLNEQMPAGLFGAVGGDEDRVAWRLSPEPFWLSPATLAAIERLGPELLRFTRALASLYGRSARGTAPAFVADYLDRGKSESVVKLGRQNRFKSDVAGVIRPDLILTDAGFTAAELDSIPGGMGFVGAMAQAYCGLGFDTVGETNGMADGFAAMLRSTSGVERPVTAIVVSEESGDYRAELTWLANAMCARGFCDTYVCKPDEIVFTEEALFVRLPGGREEKIDVLYRNFELFDLLNVPKSELMLYAARHNRVKMTPPPKAHLEEKLAFELLHDPQLATFWRKELGPEAFANLLTVFPRTWVLDPRPLPPQATIPGLSAGEEPLRDWMQLATLGKSERDYVVKPSGYSELAWGSHGVKVANDLTKEEWEAALREGLASFEHSPYVLQRFHKGKRVRVPYYDRATDAMAMLDGRVRLCPYFFVVGEGVRLGGILATIAPADKRLIHGMSDAIMSPCGVREGGA